MQKRPDFENVGGGTGQAPGGRRNPTPPKRYFFTMQKRPDFENVGGGTRCSRCPWLNPKLGFGTPKIRVWGRRKLGFTSGNPKNPEKSGVRNGEICK